MDFYALVFQHTMFRRMAFSPYRCRQFRRCRLEGFCKTNAFRSETAKAWTLLTPYYRTIAREGLFFLSEYDSGPDHFVALTG